MSYCRVVDTCRPHTKGPDTRGGRSGWEGRWVEMEKRFTSCLFILKVATIHRAHVQSFTSYSVFPRDPTLWGKNEVRMCLL